MSSNPTRPRRSAPAVNDPVITLHTEGGDPLPLTLNEFRLALLGLVDFDRDWEALQLATTFIIDGAAKLALIRERLAPAAASLPALLNRGVDSMELLAARHWFRHSRVQSGG